jgi:hypothetical protein
MSKKSWMNSRWDREQMGADGVPNNLSVKGYEYDIHEY